jgi:hypothetical protein
MIRHNINYYQFKVNFYGLTEIPCTGTAEAALEAGGAGAAVTCVSATELGVAREK